MATIVNHVINHDLTLREAGQRLELRHHTVSSIMDIWTGEQIHLQLSILDCPYTTHSNILHYSKIQCQPTILESHQ